MIVGKARLEAGLRVYAIGDIHGCIEQFDALIAKIDRDLKENPCERHMLVFLGDYVDRGPASKDVVQRLIKLESSKRECRFIMGNHDEGLLAFLRSPDLFGNGFMKWGGLATLISYGIDDVGNYVKKYDRIAKQLRKLMPEGHREFLGRLSPSLEIGDYFFCHAGVRPGIRLSKQKVHDLMWIREDFLLHPEPFEKVIVHGHTPVDKPDIRKNRINADTGCYRTGVLTAVVLEKKNQRIVNTK